ncbi:MAG: hypothetical protein Q9174_006843, partial [Haloplaca sp. 1 TL-2023]
LLCRIRSGLLTPRVLSSTRPKTKALRSDILGLLSGISHLIFVGTSKFETSTTALSQPSTAYSTNPEALRRPQKVTTKDILEGFTEQEKQEILAPYPHVQHNWDKILYAAAESLKDKTNELEEKGYRLSLKWYELDKFNLLLGLRGTVAPASSSTALSTQKTPPATIGGPASKTSTSGKGGWRSVTKELFGDRNTSQLNTTTTTAPPSTTKAQANTKTVTVEAGKEDSAAKKRKLVDGGPSHIEIMKFTDDELALKERSSDWDRVAYCGQYENTHMSFNIPSPSGDQRAAAWNKLQEGIIGR